MTEEERTLIDQWNDNMLHAVNSGYIYYVVHTTNRRTHDRYLGHSPPATNAAVTYAS